MCAAAVLSRSAGFTLDITGTEDAELIALRVGQDSPRDVITLTNVNASRTESFQTVDLCVPVLARVWREVDMQSVLGRLRIRDAHEDQTPARSAPRECP